MEGKTHRRFAPLFTLGSTILLTRGGIIKHEASQLTTIAVATASSMLTATAPDGDLHSFKPLYVIWGLPSMNQTPNGAYKVKTPGGVKTYRTPKSFNMRIWGTFFKIMGVTKHRDFRSHSPVLWVPLWYLLYTAISKVTKPLGIGGDVISSIVLGMALGYISHIVGDIPNKSGVPFLPGMRNVSPVKLLPKFMQGFFKSGNSGLNFLILFGTINAIIIIIFGNSVIPIYRSIFKVTLGLLNLITNIVLKVLGGLVRLIRGE